jgi:glycosyltransferase involved in cell wall biosynthesis
MLITVITPNYNGGRFLEEAVRSVVGQREDGVNLEYIVVDGGSVDGSPAIIEKYASGISHVISEPDRGPAHAINKGLERAGGDILCWLNSDDRYEAGALKRVVEVMSGHPDKALCFGHCPIIGETGAEVRAGITRFKEFFFPISSRFAIQCINYLSQPATFFRRAAYMDAGPLREDIRCAWDYEFFLRLWRRGGAAWIRNPPLASFRWHEGSLSGRLFRLQFKEEWEAAARDAGRFSPQALIHLGVRWGIVLCYSAMAARRRRVSDGKCGRSA